MNLHRKEIKILMRALAVVLCIVIHTGTTAADQAQDSFTAETQQETLMRFADRILTNQLPDGAIVMGDPASTTHYVNPYFSNLAAFGLMRAYEITRVPRFLQSRKGSFVAP